MLEPKQNGRTSTATLTLSFSRARPNEPGDGSTILMGRVLAISVFAFLPLGTLLVHTFGVTGLLVGYTVASLGTLGYTIRLAREDRLALGLANVLPSVGDTRPLGEVAARLGVDPAWLVKLIFRNELGVAVFSVIAWQGDQAVGGPVMLRRSVADSTLSLVVITDLIGREHRRGVYDKLLAAGLRTISDVIPLNPAGVNSIRPDRSPPGSSASSVTSPSSTTCAPAGGAAPLRSTSVMRPSPTSTANPADSPQRGAVEEASAADHRRSMHAQVPRRPAGCDIRNRYGGCSEQPILLATPRPSRRLPGTRIRLVGCVLAATSIRRHAMLRVEA